MLPLTEYQADRAASVLDGSPSIDTGRVAAIYEQLLDELVPSWRTDAHMQRTPERAAKFWHEFIDYDAGNVATTFPVDHVDQMVAVTGIETWSLCAHHLLPFSVTIDIGYLADTSVLGLSKFARIAHAAAHRPTTQEQLAADIADSISAFAGTQDVAVRASGLHLCMAMRGVRTPATMTTSVMRGAFRSEGDARGEWMALLASK